jgi:hypothetical protein
MTLLTADFYSCKLITEYFLSGFRQNVMHCTVYNCRTQIPNHGESWCSKMLKCGKLLEIVTNFVLLTDTTVYV